MVSCPICGAAINADFGMVTCKACDSVFMIEIDGTVTLPAAEENQQADFTPAEELPEEPPVEEAPAADFGFTPEEPAAEPTEYILPADEGSFETAGEAAVEGDAIEMPFDTSEAEPVEGAPVAEPVEGEESAGYSEDFLQDLDGGSTPPPPDPNDPLGVSQFDGAEASTMADGPFYYDVRISGIDTASLKEQVMDALSDKRLGWSPDEIKKKIRMGQLLLEDLNPVRAVLVVTKLQTLDVDVEWDQKPFTAEPEIPQDQET
jgi:hypothetical protein